MSISSRAVIESKTSVHCVEGSNENLGYIVQWTNADTPLELSQLYSSEFFHVTAISVLVICL